MYNTYIWRCESAKKIHSDEFRMNVNVPLITRPMSVSVYVLAIAATAITKYFVSRL